MTTLPGDIIEFSPIVTPEVIIAPGLITAPDFMLISATLRGYSPFLKINWQ